MTRIALHEVCLWNVALLLLAACAASAAPKTIHLEAEDAQLSGPSVATVRAGYSGTGYVSGFTQSAAKIVWTVRNAAAGIYTVRLRYSAPNGPKGTDIVVNGSRASAMLAPTPDAFATQDAGRVELRSGLNTVAIERGWGFYDIDALDLVPMTANTQLKMPPAVPTDPQATPEARALLRSLRGVYGKKTLSGQQDTRDADYVFAVTGQRPAIAASDFIEYTPSRVEHGSKPGITTEDMIQAAKNGSVVTMCWHWNAPTDLIDHDYTGPDGKIVHAHWWSGFYTNSTTFDFADALAHPDSDNYRLMLRDIDTIAVQLKKMQAAHVPVLWRPLHEAEGGWFWWGAKGPEPFKALWKLVFTRLTQHHHLHNLLWVYSSGTDPRWYPGDAYVDIVGIDQYPADWSDACSPAWETLQKQYGGRKLITLSEFGGVPDVDKMQRFGVRWAYFVSWTGNVGPHKLPPDELKRIYNSPLVVTHTTLTAALHAPKPPAR